MSSFSAGKEVLSYCGKCKLSLGHIIVSMKDTATIGKVQCNTCQATHMYKDPSTKTKRAKAGMGTGPKKRSSKKTVSIGQLWMDEMGKASGKSKPYSVKDLFVVGDIMDHKKFGPGIVQNLIDDKIEVLFQHELKILVHGK